ncbi:addiction module toxin, HicA family [Desulfofundulus sp. TPOSR]|uniref:type II toxin-antitoxin system HicA family toxin n=1 Tax=Desulfofundulus sp. TPOSR TaxID=2714340 RepID=UPI00140BBB87|nr:addiction module toxin, HicA family [Desulfofundulus sp. TPOSR]
MSHLPQVTGEELIRALQRLGFYVHRKKGSHRFLKHKTDPNRFRLSLSTKEKPSHQARLQKSSARQKFQLKS